MWLFSRGAGSRTRISDSHIPSSALRLRGQSPQAHHLTSPRKEAGRGGPALLAYRRTASLPFQAFRAAKNRARRLLSRLLWGEVGRGARVIGRNRDRRQADRAAKRCASDSRDRDREREHLEYRDATRLALRRFGLPGSGRRFVVSHGWIPAFEGMTTSANSVACGMSSLRGRTAKPFATTGI